MAWRFVRRSPARSALIAVLVALPVLAGTFVAVTIRTAELSPTQAATRFMGTADAIAVVTPYRRLDPTLSVTGYAGGFAAEPGMSTSTGGGTRPAQDVNVRRLLPEGSRAIPAGWQRYVNASATGRRAPVTAVLLDLTDPLTRGLYDVRTGRAPRVGEVAVTTHLAARLHVGIDSRMDVSGSSVTVAAIIRDPSSLSADEVVGPAASLGGAPAFPGKYAVQDLNWLISFPGSPPDLHGQLAADGVIYETRAQWEHPPLQLTSSVHLNSQGRAILGSIIGFGLAEIILLAGTAFAVGVRRQARELGLLRAVGGDERDVRRVILLQGLLLGSLGALLGVGLGFLTFVLGRGVLEGFADRAFGPLDARVAEIVGVAAVGVVAAVLAAVIPARTSARLSILDMLRTRFRIDVRTARVPRWARLALIGGPALVVVAAAAWHHSSGTYGGAASVSIGGVISAVASTPADDGRWTALISVGAAITLAGIARACPSLVTHLGRSAGRLPVSLRLATRDAARHRHRTAPAVAAVATVVAGAVLVLLVLSSTDIKNRDAYLPLYPVGTLGVSITDRGDTTEALNAGTKAIARHFNGDGAIVSRAVLMNEGANDTVGVHAPGCSGQDSDCYLGPVGVADPDVVRVVSGHSLPRVATALTRGDAIVLNPSLAPRGRVTIDETRWRHSRPRAVTVTLPAVVLDAPDHGNIPTVIVAPATADAHGWSSFPLEGLVRPEHVPSQSTADRYAATFGDNVSIYVERGYHSGLGVVLLALLGSAALAVLLGTSIAVALAMTESRPDMATFAAIGASPGRRRFLAMAQAAAVGSLGTALGLPLGLLVGIALLEGSTSYPFTVPVRWIALLVVSAPLLAVIVAGSVTRSSLPLTRRLG